MAVVPGVIAHGGLAGALVESLVFVTVAAILIAVWLRGRQAGESEGPARLRDEDET